jgi:hypothetical protein
MEITNGRLSSNEDAIATNRLRLLACFVLPFVLSVLFALVFEPIGSSSPNFSENNLARCLSMGVVEASSPNASLKTLSSVLKKLP